MTSTTTNQTDIPHLLREAEIFLTDCGRELGRSPGETEHRIREVRRSIREQGTYAHTNEELAHGARMAWRNANRCIGRLFWNRLAVFDAREAETPEAVYEALLRHLAYATNGGEIRPALTAFRPAEPGREPVRIWNHQLLRYAGYARPDGSVLGDPHSVAFTRACEALGWRGEGTAFDLLPLVVQTDGAPPRLFELPRELVLEVPIRHPDYDLFQGEEVKWYAVPLLTDMRLEIGGIAYPAAPFNGWYMGTEIGARNLADPFRYNLLPRVAEGMGLETSSNASLWKDRALVELNAAVLHSYRERGVSIVDHHTAAQQFEVFQRNEEKEGRAVTGRWSWLIPPLSPATTSVFHSRLEDRQVYPGFVHQPTPYE
ncbi:nitric oxide synthase oxygenase [Paenibacillus sp. J31TS4]|uniref:nitric oxide synthase oxygenase n=1 Tax=Paenibacillus sp. J31TS4 TaxID=2807195 RepID=UPI001B195471|nr:nitric oxide synthase oxygenase [Paenibacillus sp. J31TS4]GIP40318.1 nitric oxide synthase oxygenase [Paenibacillus sp. J31TS4]